MIERVLFARVGYMNLYRGSANEKPLGGGSYTEKNVGLEACNFLNIEQDVYGYFQPAGFKPNGLFNGTINLRKIDPAIPKSDEKIENVLVIFFATKERLSIPDKGPVTRSVIVGWYKNATVYAGAQSLEQKRDGVDKVLDSYFIKANKKDMYLIPDSNRKYRLGGTSRKSKKGNPGRSNSFFIYDEKYNLKKDRWISEAIDFVHQYNGPILQSDTDFDVERANIELEGAGFQKNQKIKQAIEKYSTERTIQDLEERGFKVQEYYPNGQKVCSKESFDLIAYKDNVEYVVEVKGTQLDGSAVIFTNNEVELYKKNKRKVILSVVHSIQISKEKVVKGSGKVVIQDPFKLVESKLEVISYIYKFNK
ncbi:hypothetical protein F3J02_03855 [Acinetobacter sp. Tr-809]|uniref:protein NO VEIN domain-containing protein n=1 Tax=Acinetobacter sp. Tr-809 TaxID=2608324 RepID=UPI00142074F0|nr:DUF3883 domain-containing protein [Acinetobacter sp. Tr-809]NIE95624.1 hypothetical protein [Acinetobacter sp. Tr-809]